MAISEGKVLVYLVKPVGVGPVVVTSRLGEALEFAKDLLEGCGVGDGVEIKLGEMTPEELRDLPEHDGW